MTKSKYQINFKFKISNGKNMLILNSASVLTLSHFGIYLAFEL